MKVPEEFSFDFLRSAFGRFYFKIFFRYIFGIYFFTSYFEILYKEFKKFLRKRLHVKLKKNYKFLRFFDFKIFSKEIKEFQLSFNFFICSKLSNNLVLKKNKYNIINIVK